MINNFREMLPRPDKRRALLIAVGSMLKCVFVTATFVDVKELHSTEKKCTELKGTLFTQLITR
jgi:hypothetical protein